MRNLSVGFVLGLALLGVGNAVSNATDVDVLVNGDFETGIGIPNWTLTTSITGIPGSTYPSVFEHSSNAAYPTFDTGLGLYVKPATADNGPDYNHNTIVDAADYVLWARTRRPGTAATPRGITRGGPISARTSIERSI